MSDRKMVAVMLTEPTARAWAKSSFDKGTVEYDVCLACRRALRPDAPSMVELANISSARETQEERQRVSRWATHVLAHGWEIDGDDTDD